MATQSGVSEPKHGERGAAQEGSSSDGTLVTERGQIELANNLTLLESLLHRLKKGFMNVERETRMNHSVLI